MLHVTHKRSPRSQVKANWMAFPPAPQKASTIRSQRHLCRLCKCLALEGPTVSMDKNIQKTRSRSKKYKLESVQTRKAVLSGAWNNSKPRNICTTLQQPRTLAMCWAMISGVTEYHDSAAVSHNIHNISDLHPPSSSWMPSSKREKRR